MQRMSTWLCYARASWVLLVCGCLVFAGGCGEDDVFTSAERGSVEWEERTPLGFPYSYDFVATPDDRLFVLARRERISRSVVLQSDDGGDTWAEAGLDGRMVGSLQVGGPYLFAGVTDEVVVPSVPRGLYRCRVAEGTWELAGLAHSFVTVTAAAGPRVYVTVTAPENDGGHETLHYSGNWGTSWRQSAREWRDVRSVVAMGDAVFAVDDYELLRSYGGASSWETVMAKGALRVFTGDGEVVAGYTERAGSLWGGFRLPPRQLLHSPDLGETWLDMVETHASVGPFLLDSSVYMGSGNSVLRFSRGARRAVVPRRAKIRWTRDWEQRELVLPADGVRVKAFAASDTYLYVVTERGHVFRARRPV